MEQAEKRTRELVEMAATLKEIKRSTGLLGQEVAKLKELIADIQHIQMAR